MEHMSVYEAAFLDNDVDGATMSGLDKDALEDAISEGSVMDRNVSIAVKMMLGALQWSLVWYRPRPGEPEAERKRLADVMVASIVAGI